MELTFETNLKKPEERNDHYKISVIVRKHKSGKATFYGATAKGKYLEGVQRIAPDMMDTSFIVKFAQETGVNWPSKEGVFDLEFDGEAWLDTRDEDPSKHCVRIKGTGFKLTLTHELFDKKAE